MFGCADGGEDSFDVVDANGGDAIGVGGCVGEDAGCAVATEGGGGGGRGNLMGLGSEERRGTDRGWETGGALKGGEGRRLVIDGRGWTSV